MKQFKTIICLFTLVFAFAFLAQAQEAVELEKTVVTATKTERMLQEVPASVSVVTSEEIERKGATSVADLYGRAASEAKDESSDGAVEKLGSWETANFTLGTYFGEERQYRFDVNVNNIFDREYEMAHGNLLEPGFHVVAKATITF